MITPDRFIELKAAIKAECQRRTHTGSVADYGGANYDYTNIPAANKTIDIEHYQKNLVPMNAINNSEFPVPNSYGVQIKESDMAAMEEAVASYATREVGSEADNSASDCAASCTGLCHSCTGNCVNSCTNTCTGTCTDTCTGSCTGCSGSCSGSCTGSCSGSCVWGCMYYNY